LGCTDPFFEGSASGTDESLQVELQGEKTKMTSKLWPLCRQTWGAPERWTLASREFVIQYWHCASNFREPIDKSSLFSPQAT
jgi:hypothetical protein